MSRKSGMMPMPSGRIRHSSSTEPGRIVGLMFPTTPRHEANAILRPAVFEEGHGETDEVIRRIPRHKMLAIVDDVNPELRIDVLQHCGAVGGMRAVIAAEDHQHWYPHICK